MNRKLAQRVLRRAQRFHLLDHSEDGKVVCDGRWRGLYEFAQTNYLGHIGTDHNWKIHQEWRNIGEQVMAILRGIA